MTDMSRAVSNEYGPRYSPFSTYAPQTGGPSAAGQSWLPADFDPQAVLRAYVVRAAGAGDQWAINQLTPDNAEEATA